MILTAPAQLPTPADGRRPAGSRLIAGVLERLPGLALCGVVTLAALALQGLERRVFGRAWLESLVLAILLGTAVRSLWTPGERWRPGVEFSAKMLLEIAVVLLGASVSAATLVAAGPALLVGVAAVVAIALAASYGLGRLLGLTHHTATLVACGNSICGNSAIAAVAPVIGADGDEVASAIAFTAVLGVVAVLGLPLLGAALHMGALPFGAFAGLTVYAVPQVLAATAPMGAAAVRFGTLVKLVRVLMLGPVCLALSLLARGGGEEAMEFDGRPTRTRPAVHQLVPWFILGFLAMVATRSLGAIPAAVLPALAAAASVLTVISMAALGLGTDIKVVARAGGRMTLAVVGSLAMLGVVSLALISVLHLR